jgi:hypothetical protein
LREGARRESLETRGGIIRKIMFMAMPRVINRRGIPLSGIPPTGTGHAPFRNWILQFRIYFSGFTGTPFNRTS